jgi:hypothetical protein
MALGSTQPLTEMSARNLPGGKGRPALKADLTSIYERIVWKMWESRRLTTLWASTTCYRDSFTFFYLIRGKGICGKESIAQYDTSQKFMRCALHIELYFFPLTISLFPFSFSIVPLKHFADILSMARLIISRF